MNKNAIVRIVIWSIVVLVLLAVLIAGLSHNFFVPLRLAGKPVVSSQNVQMKAVDADETVTVPAAEIRSIDIDWVSGSVTIAPGDVEEITFCESVVSNDKYRMVWKQSGDKLTIQFCKDSESLNFGIHLNDGDKNLLITVPRDWVCDSLELDAASTELTVRDLTIREVEIDTASGTGRFDGCTVSTLDVDTASGDVTFTGSLGELEFDAASAGFVGVLSNVPDRINVDSMSGDLDITLPEDAGFTVNMDTMSGDFSSDFPTTSKNGSHICADGRCKIIVSAMSGDVTIRKAA